MSLNFYSVENSCKDRKMIIRPSKINENKEIFRYQGLNLIKSIYSLPRYLYSEPVLKNTEA